LKVFIVSAHPEPKSLNTALRDLSVRVLEDLGHVVRISDLYGMDFNPVASADDFTERQDPDYLVYALEQRHGYENGTLAPDILEEIEKVLWCDLLILNFPLFWFSTPAIFKGWIDRVLISGLTYGGKRFYERGGLRGRKAMVTLTLGGRPHMLNDDGIHGDLEDMLCPLLRGTLYYTGLSVLPPFVAWHVPYITDDARADYLDAYEQRLGQLEELEPITFPSLDEFDDKLYRLNGKETE